MTHIEFLGKKRQVRFSLYALQQMAQLREKMTDSNETGDVALLVYCGLLGGCRAELQTPDFSFGDVEDEIADMLLAGDDGAKQLEEVSQELTRSTAYQSIIKAANEVTNEPPKKKAVKKKQAK